MTVPNIVDQVIKASEVLITIRDKSGYEWCYFNSDEMSLLKSYKFNPDSSGDSCTYPYNGGRVLVCKYIDPDGVTYIGVTVNYSAPSMKRYMVRYDSFLKLLSTTEVY